MDADAVADLECVRVGFLLFFLDRIDDLVHKNSSQSGRRASNTQGKIATEKNPAICGFKICRWPRLVSAPKAFGAGPARIRTWDQGIMSPLL
jgi:hypothetical protein